MAQEAKHTPGPWMLGYPDYKLGTVAVGCDFGNKEGEFSIAEVCSGSPYEFETTLADARLIAAAPDLYEATAKMVDYADRNSPLTFQYEKAMDFIALMRIALAKAHGELTDETVAA